VVAYILNEPTYNDDTDLSGFIPSENTYYDNTELSACILKEPWALIKRAECLHIE
jgi:hypothetical protein